MRLIERENIGKQVHRSGWPHVMEAVGRHATPGGLLLDDCVEASFLFRPQHHPHREPWVGIFHFPHDVVSPMGFDRARNSAWSLWARPDFKKSLPRLRGAVSMCSRLAAWLAPRLGVPVATIMHPTETGVTQWNPGCLAEPKMLQVGWHLRNTRAIYHVPPANGWRYLRIAPVDRWQRRRDARIRRRLGSEPNGLVEDLPRLDDAEYDEALATSVVVMEVWGAAANNVVVECVARGTPLLVNRLPAVEEYLGEDYPLYFRRLRDVPALLRPERLVAASEHMRGRRGRWLELDTFAGCLAEFVRRIETC